MECKYCLQEIEIGEKDIFPCECKNPVHKKCLDEWNNKRKSDYNRCEICDTEYKFTYYRFCRCSFQKIYIVITYLFFLLLFFLTIIVLLELQESNTKMVKFEKITFKNMSNHI